MNWHKTLFPNSVLLCSVLSAQENTTLDALNQRLCKLENTVHHSANPSSLLAPGFFVQVDLLFWQAREDGLSYAIVADNPRGFDIFPRDFHVKEPEFEWDFGFRVGLGYGGRSDGWDVFAQWTRFVTDAEDKGSISSGKFFLPVWADPNFHPFPFEHITEAEAHWKLQFNEIDVRLGRGYCISKFLTARPFIGPSSVWIDQHYHIEYEKPAIFTIPTRKDHIHIHNAFFGIGASAGCELRFRFTRNLSLLTRGLGAIYAGRFEISRKEKLESILGNKFFKIKQDIHAGRAATALEMGLCWEHSIQNKYYVRAELCYDIHYFFKQNQMPRLIARPLTRTPTYFSDQGDLALQGGSFSVTVGF